MADTLYLVVPCYNEEEVLEVTCRLLTEKLKSMMERNLISSESRMMFVDDGSKDSTWKLIESLCESNPLVQGLKLSRNRGHQNALLAGLMTAKEHCDMAISLDADLQDDIDALDRFVEAYNNGHDVVYGVRNSRTTDSWFKRNTAQGFYKLMKLLGVDLVYNHADYRLMSKRALEGLEDHREVNLFLRGIVPLVGYPSTTVEYERKERFVGESKYPLTKMLKFAFEGITSFSVRPIRMVTTLGLIIFLISLIMLIYTLIVFLIGHTVAGWSTMMISIWAIGGLQLLAIGIVGEYIGKIYMETKQRPKFLIEEYRRGGSAQ